MPPVPGKANVFQQAKKQAESEQDDDLVRDY
jgi:hypothetical protein